VHILFVNHHHLDSNSGIHIFNLANQLSRLGMKCTVCVPNNKDAARALGHCEFEIINFDEIRYKMRPGQVDLIHAWTPRELVRKMTETLAYGFDIPYLVHLEDNEEIILESNLSMSVENLLDLPERRLNPLIPDYLSHPVRYKHFLNQARGVTMLIDTLQAFVPENEAKAVIWPGYQEDLQWHRPPDNALRSRLEIDPSEYIVVYTGNVHKTNQREVSSLYLAVGLLNRRGMRTKLVRTGTDYVPLYEDSLRVLDQFCVSLGQVPRTELPAIVSMADALVQPGRADAFNMYRFPSKLPEYFASGKPVLLPAVNIGRFLRDEEQAILLQKGNALEIAQKLEGLFQDQARQAKIGTGGRLFAEENLKWSQSAKKLFDFYDRLLNV